VARFARAALPAQHPSFSHIESNKRAFDLIGRHPALSATFKTGPETIYCHKMKLKRDVEELFWQCPGIELTDKMFKQPIHSNLFLAVFHPPINQLAPTAGIDSTVNVGTDFIKRMDHRDLLQHG
jgi:hypothetical protein